MTSNKPVLGPQAIRWGFTIVEVLTVVALLGLLVSLIAPAVFSAREASRRTQCLNNQKQVALAIQNHQHSFRLGPEADSLPRELATELEHRSDDLFEQLPPVWRCPAESLGGSVAAHSYLACVGTGSFADRPVGEHWGDGVVVNPSGVGGLEQICRDEKILDGTSNTLLISERLVTEFNEDQIGTQMQGGGGRRPPRPRAVWFTDHPASDADDFVVRCGSADRYWPRWDPLYREGGRIAFSGEGFDCVGPPNSTACLDSPTITTGPSGPNVWFTRSLNPASSEHRQGVVACRADGSGRFESDTIAIPVWRALGTVAGHETIDGHGGAF